MVAMRAARSTLLSMLVIAITLASALSLQSILHQTTSKYTHPRNGQSHICRYSNNHNHDHITSRGRHALSGSALLAKMQRAEDEAPKVESGKGVTIPFGGLVGMETGELFVKPIEEYDPLKNTDDLPGEDGSPEKIAAIQKRIEQKVAALKAAGEWDVESFGSDPLANIPLWQIMYMQLKACKPYDSVSELFLTYTLVLVTTTILSVYLLWSRDILDTVMPWYLNTDFDSEFFSRLFDFSGLGL